MSDETYKITPEGMVLALKAEAYASLGHTNEQIIEKLGLRTVSELQILMMLMPEDLTLSALGLTPEQALEG